MRLTFTFLLGDPNPDPLPGGQITEYRRFPAVGSVYHNRAKRYISSRMLAYEVLSIQQVLSLRAANHVCDSCDDRVRL